MELSKRNIIVSLLLALYLTSPSLAQFFSPATNPELPAVPPPITDDLTAIVGYTPPPLAPPVFANNNLPFGKALRNQPNDPQQQQQGLVNQPLVGLNQPVVGQTQPNYPQQQQQGLANQPLVGLNQPFSTMDPSLGSGNQMGYPRNLPFESWATVERASILVASLACLVAFTAHL